MSIIFICLSLLWNSKNWEGCISWDDWCGSKSQRKASHWDAGLVQRCMKTLVEYCELITATQVVLSDRSSTLRPASLRDQSLIAITTVRSSSSLICRPLAKINSGNSRWKYSPKHTAPQPVRQASVANNSGLEITTSEGITETPLKCERKNNHQSISECNSSVTGKEALLGREWQERRAFRRRHIKARPGRTHADTNESLPSNCWSSRREKEVLHSHFWSSCCSSETRKAGTDKVMSKVSIQIPRQSIWWQGGTSFSGEASRPSSVNREFIRWKDWLEQLGDSAP